MGEHPAEGVLVGGEADARRARTTGPACARPRGQRHVARGRARRRHRGREATSGGLAEGPPTAAMGGSRGSPKALRPRARRRGTAGRCRHRRHCGEPTCRSRRRHPCHRPGRYRKVPASCTSWTISRQRTDDRARPATPACVKHGESPAIRGTRRGPCGLARSVRSDAAMHPQPWIAYALLLLASGLAGGASACSSSEGPAPSTPAPAATAPPAMDPPPAVGLWRRQRIGPRRTRARRSRRSRCSARRRSSHRSAITTRRR